MNRYAGKILKIRSFIHSTPDMSKRVAKDVDEPNLRIGKMSKRGNEMTLGKTNVRLEKTDGCCSTVSDTKPNNFIVLPTPVKSPQDEREYRVIKLENGLTVLLISDVKNLKDDDLDPVFNDEILESENDDSGSSSDESTNESLSPGSLSEEDKCQKKTLKQEEKLAAVALCVGVGGFSDPDNIPGLAHFLEHMVFMGSEKYPTENSFDEYIKMRGGSTNATTETEYTTFYFDCHKRHLPAVIDRFVQFFIAPLMRRDAMTREREAVDSEFQMSAPLDSTRKEQFVCGLAKDGHPARKFTWGNMKTLRDNIDDDELYEALHTFRKRHYSAHRMTAAIQAGFPMSTLENLATIYFSDIPSNYQPPDDFSQYENSFDTDRFHKIYKVLPMKDIVQVDLTWAFPSLRSKYRSKPAHYLSWIIGHEGKGSLLALLRKRLWATDIYSGNDESGTADNSMYALFTISIVLTAAGYKNVDQVLNLTFGYIQLLRNNGPSYRIFEELKASEDNEFQFAGEISASEYVEQLVEGMQYYPPEDYLTGPELYFEYEPEAIEDCINLMTPDRVNILIQTSDSSLNFNEEEFWFKTRYTFTDIPAEWKEIWSNLEPHRSFDLPEPNLFVPTDFEIIKHSEPVPSAPIKIQSDAFSEVWYRPDDKFKKPLTYIYCSLNSPLPSSSPCNYVMLELFVSIFNRHIAEELYPADMMGMKTAIKARPRGIVIKIDGFSHKLHLLMELIAQQLASYSDMLNESVCDTMLEEQKKIYYNEFVKPSKLSRDLRYSVLVLKHWTNLEKYSAARKITLPKLEKFISEMLNNLYIQVLIQGNYSQQQAIKVTNVLLSSLPCKNAVPMDLIRARVREIATGKFFCIIPSLNDDDKNSTVTNYYQSGPIDLTSSCILEVLMLLMEEPLFNTLRTRKQLGYAVAGTYLDTFGMLGFCIVVHFQADKFTAKNVDEEIESFLKQFLKFLKKLKKNDYEKAREAVIEMLKCADLQLKDEVERHWTEISSGDLVFDRWRKEVECVRDIELPDVIRWFEKQILSANSRKLSIQVIGHTHGETKKKGDTKNGKKGGSIQNISSHERDAENTLKSIMEYRENLFVYPVINLKINN